ncbi:MAG: hypothetical protein EOP83_26085 [Verrucomicrobiaceae bacterium]|nr:MAG: hypothetical protein EOP83_26085 [Verrucomicrobiaceae bacterium]
MNPATAAEHLFLLDSSQKLIRDWTSTMEAVFTDLPEMHDEVEDFLSDLKRMDSLLVDLDRDSINTVIAMLTDLRDRNLAILARGRALLQARVES